MELDKLVEPLIGLCRTAGERILEVYRKDDFGIEYKDDDSPLTVADRNSHVALVEGLSELSDLPILSEEAADISWAERQSWTQYWLLDPLDGTKEFIKKNGEFTVNVALIDRGKPVLGVVYVPDKEILYYGVKGVGAFRVDGTSGAPVAIQVAPLPDADQPWRLVGSRSHQSEAFKIFAEQFDNPKIVSMGSSLKLCLVAEGAADLYPRLGLTSEWDTAAAQAVVEAAGGRVIDWETKRDLRYNCKDSLLNPSFIVCAKTSPAWFKESGA